MTVSASAETYRLDVIGLARWGLGLIVERWRLMVALGWSAFALIFAAELAAAAIGGRTLLGALLVGLVRAICVTVFGAIFIVRWHRFVLRDETVPGDAFSNEWRLFVVAGIKLTLLLFVGMILISLIAAALPAILGVPLGFIGFVAMLAAAVRASLVFPAAALGSRMSFRASSNLMSGNGLRLFGCAVLTYLPFLILGYLAGEIGAVSPWIIWILFQGLSTAIALAGAAAVATLLSDVYRNVAMPASA